MQCVVDTQRNVDAIPGNTETQTALSTITRNPSSKPVAQSPSLGFFMPAFRQTMKLPMLAWPIGPLFTSFGARMPVGCCAVWAWEHDAE